MHTVKAEHGTIFNYNSDFSGDVIITTDDGDEMAVPGEDILEFVAAYVASERISEIEGAEWRHLLLKTRPDPGG